MILKSNRCAVEKQWAKFFLVLLCICTSIKSYSAPTEFKFYKNDKEKYVEVKTQEYQKISLTDDCFKFGPTPKCDAFTATTKAVEASKSKIPLIGHPAARLCLDHEGLNRILLTKDNKQYDYCLFKDGSMIDAWDLYYHFFPQKVVK